MPDTALRLTYCETCCDIRFAGTRSAIWSLLTPLLLSGGRCKEDSGTSIAAGNLAAIITIPISLYRGGMVMMPKKGVPG